MLYGQWEGSSLVNASTPKANPQVTSSFRASAASEVPSIPRIECSSFAKDFVPTCLSNGLIGIRPGSNPLTQARTVVGGFVRSHPDLRVESLAAAPYPLATDILVNGVSFLKNPGALETHRQTLDMATGELVTDMTFTPTGQFKLEFQVLQFCSRSVPSLLCQEILLAPSSSMVIEIRTSIARKGVPGSVYLSRAPSPNKKSDQQVLGFRNNRNKLGVALVFPQAQDLVQKGLGIHSLEAKSGRTYSFRTIAGMVSEVYDPEPELQALRVASWGEMVGFDLLREQNRSCWSDLWKSRVKVYGDAEAQTALDAAFFYLHSSFHSSCRTGVPPYGLSQFEHLGGRVFWDMDSWCLSPTLLASPASAKAMLEYRLRGLEAAQERAALFGYRGAQFPWEATIDGYEGSPSSIATGWAEHHITPDVALAFWEYQLATDDDVFLREGTWPVLRNVAEWIESRGIYTERGFEIRHVMGVDESQTTTNNNSYMNLVCKMAMQAATECAHKVGIIPPKNWKQIAKSIAITLDKERRFVIPYDGAEPGPAYSVGMLQFLFLHGMPVSQVLFKNTYEFEEQLRVSLPSAASNPGSPKAPAFTSPPFAVCAAFFDDRRKAAELFENAWKPYWAAPYGLAKEYRFFPDGSYVTGYGSLLQAAMFGFTGLRITDRDWRQYPAKMPAGWRRIEIDRIWVKGKPMKVIAEHGRLTELIETEDLSDDRLGRGQSIRR